MLIRLYDAHLEIFHFGSRDKFVFSLMNTSTTFNKGNWELGDITANRARPLTGLI